MSAKAPWASGLAEGVLAIVVAAVVLVVSLFFVPVPMNWQPPLKEPSAALAGKTEQEILALSKQLEEEARRNKVTLAEMAPYILRSHFPLVASVYVLWLAWRRPFTKASEVAGFFLPVLLAMLAFGSYLEPTHWILIFAIVGSTVIRSRSQRT